MTKTLTIGASIVDIYLRSSDFKLSTNTHHSSSDRWLCHRYGAKLTVDETKLTSGGGASNVAVALARLGHQSSIISEIGRDNLGEIVTKDLKLNNVNTDLLISEKHENTGVSVILVGNDGERTVLVDRGASGELDNFDIPTAFVARQDWVHITSLNGQKETMAKIFQALRVCCTSFSWNPGSQEIKFLIRGELDLNVIPAQNALLFVNREEWSDLTPRHSEINAKFNQVIVTDGRHGGHVYEHGAEVWYYHCAGGAPFDTTGAGDSFASGYIAARIFGHHTETCCDWGRYNSASVVKFYGAKQGLLTRDQIETQINRQKMIDRSIANRPSFINSKHQITLE